MLLNGMDKLQMNGLNKTITKWKGMNTLNNSLMPLRKTLITS